MNLKPFLYSAFALLVLPTLAAPIRTGLEAEADAPVTDPTTLTTELFQACEQGDTEKVRLLLQQGAEVNVRNEKHDTPLGIAIQKGHTAIVRLLIRHGAAIHMMAHCSAILYSEKELSSVISEETAVLPLHRILSGGLIAHLGNRHDVYTVEELRDEKLCYPDHYARFLSELNESMEAVDQVAEACRDWYHKTDLFAETYYAKELEPQHALWNRCDNVRVALAHAIRQDAESFARHACWYTCPLGELGPDTTSPLLYDFVAPANAPEEVRAVLAPMQEFALGKHSKIDLIIKAHHLWADIQSQEIAALRQELLHDAEVLRLFDESLAAWERYNKLMFSLHISRCCCTNGTENHELGIWMLAHRAVVLNAIRYMSKELRFESEYLQQTEAQHSAG